jgi:hypothetical protein
MNWFYRVNGQVITRVVSRRVCVCVYWRLRRPPTFLPSSTKEFVRYTILSNNGSNNAIITLIWRSKHLPKGPAPGYLVVPRRAALDAFDDRRAP